MSREIRWIGSGELQVFDDPWQGGYRARLFRLDARGRWHPPLPPDVAAELPVKRSRSFSRSASSQNELSKASLALEALLAAPRTREVEAPKMKTKKKPAADEIVSVAVPHANERGAFGRGERVGRALQGWI